MTKNKKKQKKNRLRKIERKKKKGLQRKQKSSSINKKSEIENRIGPKPKREISPVENLDAEQYIDMMINDNNPHINELKRIRIEKAIGKRNKPSNRLTGDAEIPPIDIQKLILDEIAMLVDENLFGRSEMCIQFSSLLALALNQCGFKAKAYKGRAHYKKKDGTWFSWEHAWVIYDDYIIDGNTDSMIENIMVDAGIDQDPFWGKINSMPEDRYFDLDSSNIITPDNDSITWWKDLSLWLNSNRDMFRTCHKLFDL